MYLRPGRRMFHTTSRKMGRQVQGKFDQGWDKLREETFARQKRWASSARTVTSRKRHREIPAWDDISPEMNPSWPPDGDLRRFLEHTDHHVGRLIDALATWRSWMTLSSITSLRHGASGEAHSRGRSMK